MAIVASARMIISLLGATSPASPRFGELSRTLENGSGGARWTHGQASGMIDHVYQVDGTLAAAATDSYNTLAAGSLTDLLGGAIDLDELKAFVLVCNTGSIKFVAPAANFLSLFVAATDGINLTAGQAIGLDLAAAGLAVGANGKFDITDTFGGAGSTYSLMFVGSN